MKTGMMMIIAFLMFLPLVHIYLRTCNNSHFFTSAIAVVHAGINLNKYSTSSLTNGNSDRN